MSRVMRNKSFAKFEVLLLTKPLGGDWTGLCVASEGR